MLVSQTSFGGETSGRVSKCQLFSLANSDFACNRLFSNYIVHVSGPLLAREPLWFNSCEQPPPGSDQYIMLVFAF